MTTAPVIDAEPAAPPAREALERARPAILRAWLRDARAKLWHLDAVLLARKGPARAAASKTLEALVPLLGRAGQQAEPPTPDAPVPTAGNDLKTNADLEAALEPWTALDLSWPDLRVLITSLAACCEAALSDASAESTARPIVAAAFDRLIRRAAERRIAELDEQLSSHREESLISQHLAGRFLANASHELRTPLTAVLGFSELLQEGTYGDLNAEQKTAVDHIENSAQNLLEIVNNLLDLLHIRSGKLVPQYRPVNPLTTLTRLYEILTPLARRKDVEFRLDLPEYLGEIEADDNILRHIVYHLLASALRATPTGGKVTLTAERRPGTFVIVTHDTALHLPPQALVAIEDPFPIIENSPARGYEGWEVGLPLVRRYVDLHGGRLELESEPDRGTTFRIILPMSKRAPEEE